MPRRTFRFTSGERHVFRKLPPLRVSEWSAANLIVPDGPLKGSLWRRDFTPYSVGIMDAWGDPWTEEVDVCGTPQVGKTILMYACMGFSITRRPGPRMLSMPDDDAISKMLESKLRPLFRRTSAIRRLVRKIKTSGAVGVHFRDSTTLHLVGAQSQSQRASISVQDLFMDEEDLYKQFKGAGVPVVDLLERTRQYAGKRKILRVSKPVGTEASSIWTAIHQADELRRYEARCPACSQHQTMAEAGLVLTESTDDPGRVKREKLARYKCAHCGYLWSDHMRDVAVAAGRWRAEIPVPRPRRIGYHLPAILSRAVSLSEIMAEKLRAEATDDPDAKQAYANGYWAEPYRPVVKETPASAILKLADPALPPRIVPAGHVALTCGIDMQKHGFWFLVHAWTPGLECAVIDYGRLRDWEDVYALIWETTYERQDGGEGYPIWRAGLDTGGTKTDDDLVTRTEEAYHFVRTSGGQRLYATKGSSRPMLAPVKWNVLDKMPRSGAAIPGGLYLYTLDTEHLKNLHHARLQEDARQRIRLHAEAGQDLAAQLAAERQVRGRDGSLHWERVHRDNHYLDCACISFACANAAWTPSLQMLAQAALQARPAAQAAAPASQPAPEINPYTGRAYAGEEPRP